MLRQDLCGDACIHLCHAEINRVIREFYTTLIISGNFPEELQPHWGLLKRLFISCRGATSAETDGLLTYILAMGELMQSRDFHDVP